MYLKVVDPIALKKLVATLKQTRKDLLLMDASSEDGPFFSTAGDVALITARCKGLLRIIEPGRAAVARSVSENRAERNLGRCDE